MNKQELEQAAKEYVKTEMHNIPLLQRDLSNAPFTEYIQFASKFAQHLLDTGKMVEADAWINISERLPKKGSKVAVMLNGKTDFALFDEDVDGILCFTGIDFQCDFSDKNCPSEWQPLPSTKTSLNTPQSGKVKSLQECKDSTLIGNKYISWNELLRDFEISPALLNDYIDKAAEMFANQFKHPAYDLLLASYNALKEQNNKLAMENNRLMSVLSTLNDDTIKDLSRGQTGFIHDKIEGMKIAFKWVKDQLNKKS